MPKLGLGLSLSQIKVSGTAFDADVISYISAVETADNQALEPGVKTAINDFVVGCKADGIWSAIKASCIMAGARTLSGALVPLVGTGPTSTSFVSGDYNRKTGLLGDGSTKYLNTNRSNSADPQDNKHMSLYVTSGPTRAGSTKYMMACSTVGGSSSLIYASPSQINMRINYGSAVTSVNLSGSITGFLGVNRNNASTTNWRYTGIDYTDTNTSAAPNPANIFMYTRDPSNLASASDARVSFYSIGTNVSLTLLESRISTLMTTLASIIP
jgi:hypothetical protein